MSQVSITVREAAFNVGEATDGVRPPPFVLKTGLVHPVCVLESTKNEVVWRGLSHLPIALFHDRILQWHDGASHGM